MTHAKPFLLGHRGASHYAPENTLAAFELALAHGCDGFEMDVRVTADGRAVICHDTRLERLDVARTPYSRLVARCASLATLDEVFARLAAHAYLYIELKVAGAEDQLSAALAAHPPERGYVVASFLPQILESVHALDSRIPLGFICDKAGELPRWRTLPASVVMPRRTLVTPALIEELHAGRKEVFVWTVNREREMRSLMQLGVDGIVSDDTELLGRVLGRR